MGSLASVPSISTTPQPARTQTVRYVNVPAPSNAGANSKNNGNGNKGVSSSGDNEGNAAADPVAMAAAREGNLLRRSRGRSGTIRTSFRGLLGLRDDAQRKTLLGE